MDPRHTPSMSGTEPELRRAPAAESHDMALDVAYDLALALRNPASFAYDDPLLYQTAAGASSPSYSVFEPVWKPQGYEGQSQAPNSLSGLNTSGVNTGSVNTGLNTNNIAPRGYTNSLAANTGPNTNSLGSSNLGGLGTDPTGFYMGAPQPALHSLQQEYGGAGFQRPDHMALPQNEQLLPGLLPDHGHDPAFLQPRGAVWDMPGAFKSPSAEAMDLDLLAYSPLPGLEQDPLLYPASQSGYPPALFDVHMPDYLQMYYGDSMLQPGDGPKPAKDTRVPLFGAAQDQPVGTPFEPLPQPIDHMDMAPPMDPDAAETAAYSFLSPNDASSIYTSKFRESVSQLAPELTPLTPTTLFTPLVSSFHSAQPSFFSAQQHFRQSLDQPPSLLNRGSLDLYQRHRTSFDSLSSLNVPRQRTLASYFHFGEKDRKLLALAEEARSRGLRSIFKSTPNGEDDLEPEQDDDVSAEDDKKGKRLRRGFLTRFKAKSHEMLVEPELRGDASESEPGDDADSSMGEQPLLAVGLGGPLHEPDYGALFMGVGKRRLVKEKSKPGRVPKTEPELNSSISDDMTLAGSVQTSQRSLHSRDLVSETTPAPLSFANASKRLMSSRLMKIKGLKKADDEPAVEEKPRKTRGRKEDKAADMVDETKIFVCEHCDRRFKRQEHLKRHFRSLHTGEKPFECKICQKKFSRTDNLNQHLRIHRQESGEISE